MKPFAWSRTASSLAERVFGGTCYLCRGESAGVLCAPCDADWPLFGRPQCPQCALPSHEGRICGRCVSAHPAYDATVAPLAYAFPADVLIQGLKFRSELALAPLLAGVLARHLGTQPLMPDLVIPVPLHDLRLRERGYNQSMEIARAVASFYRLPLAADACMRVRNTTAQLGLTLSERRENMRGAFSCRQAFDGKSVAVVDDVMTTGATLDEVAATLKKFGASRVVNWVVARTPAE
jgi:ComF family protein